MKIFYTGAAKFNEIQQDSSKSLGGLISSSEIPDALLSNLWSAISKYTIYNNLNKGEYRGIVIKNDGITTLTGLKVYFTYPDESDSTENVDLYATFEIAKENVVADDCGNLSIQKLSSSFAKPYNTSFTTADGLSNALALPDLPANQYIGIWLKRTVSSIAKQPLTSDQYLAILNKTLQLEELEEINLNFVWD